MNMKHEVYEVNEGTWFVEKPSRYHFSGPGREMGSRVKAVRKEGKVGSSTILIV